MKNLGLHSSKKVILCLFLLHSTSTFSIQIQSDFFVWENVTFHWRRVYLNKTSKFVQNHMAYKQLYFHFNIHHDVRLCGVLYLVPILFLN